MKDINTIASAELRERIRKAYVHPPTDAPPYWSDALRIMPQCFASRGRNKGYLLNNPPKGELASAVWRAYMTELCPGRIGICWLIMRNHAGDQAHAVFHAAERFVMENRVLVNREAQKPCQFNLFHV